MGNSIEGHDQGYGGSFNAHKHWKKLREKHRKNDAHRARGGSRIWKPEVYTPSSSAGKGDLQRSSDVPKELYDLNFDLAFGSITREEYDKKLEELSLEDME
tara:strand:+ start:84 stop:386 length:303 start_codon:yes stop_codon:yes gene_type:complete